MILFLVGENTYMLEQSLDVILGGHIPEKIDGEILDESDLPDIFSGQTLFADKRTIVIRNASSNVSVWAAIERYISNVSDETTIIFIEAKPDKRTKTYKKLQQVGEVRDFPLPKNAREAEIFLGREANRLGMKLNSTILSAIVSRAGLEPWDLVHALEKLALLDQIDREAVERVIEASSETQVFGLFEAALNGAHEKVQRQISLLALNENAHLAFGFLTSQILQLSALVTKDSGSSIAKDMGAHPFVIQKLEPYANNLTRARLRKIITILSDCDMQMKRSGQNPWECIETALIKIAST